MLLVAIRNILQEKGRLFISLAGVTFSIILMLVLIGIYNGAIQQFTRFIDENPTDLVIAQKGISDYFHGASLLPESTIPQIEAVPGVKEALPMISQLAYLEHKEKKYDVFLASFEPGRILGAPWDVSGATDIKGNEIIISETLAKKTGKSIGDTLTLVNREFIIRGLVPDASSFGTHYAWVTLDKAREVAKVPAVNFIYVTLENPSDTSGVASQLSRQLPGTAVLTKPEFAKNNRAELEEVFLPIIGAIVGIAVIVGTAIIGLTIYTATIDKIREYGVLKALGVSNGQLFRIVLFQSLLVVTIGFVIGVLLSLAVSALLKDAIGIAPVITSSAIIGTAALGLVMGIIAAFVPLRRLMHIDPAEVFKS